MATLCLSTLIISGKALSLICLLISVYFYRWFYIDNDSGLTSFLLKYNA